MEAPRRRRRRWRWLLVAVLALSAWFRRRPPVHAGSRYRLSLLPKRILRTRSFQKTFLLALFTMWSILLASTNLFAFNTTAIAFNTRAIAFNTIQHVLNMYSICTQHVLNILSKPPSYEYIILTIIDQRWLYHYAVWLLYLYVIITTLF